MRDEISSIIRTWISEYDLLTFFDRFYLFGSLVNDGEEFFWPGGIKESDIDLLVRFNPKRSNAVDRAIALATMRRARFSLEQVLAESLGKERKEAARGSIISWLPVTWYEIYHCVHKGFDPKLYTMNIFYDIVKSEEKQDGLCDYIDKSFHFDNTETFAVMRLVQKVRNDYLRFDSDNKEKIRDFVEHDAIPKELMRAAALLKYVENPDSRIEARTRLMDGETYLRSLLASLSGVAPEYTEIELKVTKRSSSTVYLKPALTADDMVFLCEILFDRARILTLTSAREMIDKIRREKLGKPVYS